MKQNVTKRLFCFKPAIQCNCGCEQWIAAIDDHGKGRPRFYVWGHHSRGKNKYEHPRGPKHPRWRGGRIKQSEGYVYVNAEGHPKAKPNGQYVYEHIVVMEKYLGRYLLPNELVHHKNHNRGDNRIENLQLMTQHEHGAFHHPKGKKFGAP